MKYSSLGMWVRALVAACLLAGSATPSVARDTVRIGVLAYMGADYGLAEWGATVQALERALPDVDFRLLPLDLPGTRKAVEASEIDFLITNPGNYVELEAAYGISRIAMLDSTARVGSLLVTSSRNPDINTLADLRGRRLAAVSRGAFGGFQVAWRELADAGLDPFSDLHAITFTGFPMDRVLDAVRTGAADAGVVKACLLEQLAAQGEIDPTDFRVVGRREAVGYPCALSSRLYPDWPFAKLRGTKRALAKRVVTALMAYEPPPGGTGWTVPLDYQPVHDLFRELKIGPYEHLRNRTLLGMLRDYWHWLAILAVAMGWWVVHVWRVEHLVRERTAALSAANRDLEREMAERLHAEQMERKHREELEHVARLSILGEMAGHIAHELNQPLAAISNYADGCARRLERGALDREAFAEAAHHIAEQSRRAGRVIQRIRAFVRKRGYSRVPVDLNEPVREAVELFEGVAGRRGGVLRLQLAPELPLVEADKVQIQQVVLNLMQNAVDAMEACPADAREVSVHTAVCGDGVEVSVADRGPGFDAEVRDRLFEPYFTTKADGIGLGLAISHSIVEAHGGSIAVGDNPGGGAVVRFRLPSFRQAG